MWLQEKMNQILPVLIGNMLLNLKLKIATDIAAILQILIVAIFQKVLIVIAIDS